MWTASVGWTSPTCARSRNRFGERRTRRDHLQLTRENSMAFQQGLSGLSAAAQNLDVIGNNVANANTVGFKESQAQFADVYANSLAASGSTGAGIGVSVPTIQGQFSQGNIRTTSNPLDVAINGRSEER